MKNRKREWWKLTMVLGTLLALPAAILLIKQVAQLASKAAGVGANIVVDASEDVGYLPRPWLAMAQGGEELPTFLDNLEGQVAGLKLRQIRIDHLYDGFNIVSRSGAALAYDWTRLDALVDKIIKTGAKPFFALSYMPPVIAKTDIVSTPNNWGEWSEVVQKTIEHYSGEKKIRDVYYEVWNEPDLFGKMSAASYVQLYRASSVGAKRARGVLPFKLGGPATTGLYRNWVESLLKAAQRERMRLDFVSWHRYDTNPERHIKDIEEVEQFVSRFPYFSDTEVLVTEWGPYSDNNAVYDGLTGAAHMMAVVRRQLGRINLAFLFSIKDGKASDGKAYWGRWGLFTHDSSGNKAKPRYTALTWLNGLGENRLGLGGEGTWVTGIATKKGQVVQVLLTNYDIRGSHSESVPLKIKGLADGDYVYKEKLLGGGSRNLTVSATGGEVNQKVYLRANDSALIEVSAK